MIKHNMSIQDTFIDKLQQFGHAHCYLVGGFNPIWKILVKLEIFPKFRGENKQYLKPPPSYSLSKNIIKNQQLLLENTGGYILQIWEAWVFFLENPQVLLTKKTIC